MAGKEPGRGRDTGEMFKAFIAGTATTIALGLGTSTPEASASPAGDGASCATGRLDNCYTKAQMRDFLDAGDQLVLEYMDQIGVPKSALPTVVYIPDGHTVETRCTDGDGNSVEDDRAYSYCSADNTVNIGQDRLWGFYQDYGAAGPIAGLAHEYGHFLQAYTGVPEPDTAMQSVKHENQADCVSGAFVSYLDDQGNVEYPQDFKNLGGFSVEIASAEGPDRDHGTVDERIGSFVVGYTGDLSACNRFYPKTPIDA